eukprot:scaffold305438_cov57-Attheya_sp.AAC.2
MVCEVSSSSSRSGVGQQFRRESSVPSVSLGGSSARSLSSFHTDSSLADCRNHSFRIPQLDILRSRIWRDHTIEFQVVVCGLLA